MSEELISFMFFDATPKEWDELLGRREEPAPTDVKVKPKPSSEGLPTCQLDSCERDVVTSNGKKASPWCAAHHWRRYRYGRPGCLPCKRCGKLEEAEIGLSMFICEKCLEDD